MAYSVPHCYAGAEGHIQPPRCRMPPSKRFRQSGGESFIGTLQCHRGVTASGLSPCWWWGPHNSAPTHAGHRVVGRRQDWLKVPAIIAFKVFRTRLSFRATMNSHNPVGGSLIDEPVAHFPVEVGGRPGPFGHR